jgi:hypothetical protein
MLHNLYNVHLQDSFETMKSVHESQILHMGRSASKILSLTEEEFYEVRLGFPAIKGTAERAF